MKRKLSRIFRRLYSAFGRQYWWPAQSAFEVMVGAILTQNTSWSNVEKAIASLKKKKLLDAEKIYKLPSKKLSGLIRPAGYYNIKAARLKNFLKFFFDNYSLSLEKISSVDLGTLRRQLLGVNGIGQETADSILLYALNKPIFVVDAYTKRILLRHKLIKAGADYFSVQEVFMKNLKNNAGLFNEYHALLVKLGKEYCHKRSPKCEACPLNGQ
ncbi:MAG: endonuclease III domain-containing protein [Candidatus Omnitrophica bacterium]|nr:endonuclease III domain-containing protein [Candidatus Omnitrophota bacterium]MDD5660918.1 endonuclease III domain-containing protein [Candidatus Omnitrophota bacterium]